MLQFSSGSARIINTERAVAECLEIALGNDYKSADLLIFHASIGHNFETMVQKAHEMAPNARILAASCCGVIGREGVSESMKDMALMALKGNEFEIASAVEIDGKTAFEQSRKMAQELHGINPAINIFFLMASGIDIDNQKCIEGIESVFGKEITIFGATSSDNMKGIVSFQAVDTTVTEHGAWLLGFTDPTLKATTRATHGFTIFGNPLKVTKAEGNVIKELNGKPAWQEYLNLLGLPENSTCGETIPVGALGEILTPEDAGVYGNSAILRVVTKHNGNDMYYATTISEGTELWLTLRDEALIFSEMDRIANELKAELSGARPVAVFHADCLARGKSLFNKVIKEELVAKMQHPFYVNEECPPWLGMYGFGEFAKLNGRNMFHNYTTALYILYR